MSSIFIFQATVDVLLAAAAVLCVIYDKKLLIFERFIKIKIKEVIRHK